MIKKSFGQLEVELQEVYGTDRSIAESAWTSSTEYTKKKNRTEEDVKRIINFLADKKHSVPFESVILRFWIRMPIQTDRQFMTHRLQSASGMSGRYRTMPNEFFNIPDDVQYIVEKAEIPGIRPAGGILNDYEWICNESNRFYKNSLEYLKEAEKENNITNVEYKRVREFLRGALPQNNMTERLSVMNLRAFCNFIKLRMHSDAQPEIYQIAKMMLECLEERNAIPYSLEAIKNNKFVI